jgi:hypothetical protein
MRKSCSKVMRGTRAFLKMGGAARISERPLAHARTLWMMARAEPVAGVRLMARDRYIDSPPSMISAPIRSQDTAGVFSRRLALGADTGVQLQQLIGLILEGVEIGSSPWSVV